MKRLLCILMSFVLLSGCAIDSPVIYDPSLRLLFQPQMYMHVSPDEDEVCFPEDQDMAVCAWTSAGEWLSLTRAYSQKVVLTDTIRKVQVEDVLWGFDENVFWPSRGEVVSFAAYSPYDADCQVSKTNGVQWSTANVLEDQTDLLYSHIDMDRSGNVDGNVVQLCFDHALCQIDFRVKNRVDNTGALDVLNRPDKITVLEITIDGVKCKGDFASLPSAQWTLADDKVSLPIFEGSFLTSGLPEKIGTSWLMLPQTLDTMIGVKFQYTTFANTTITQVLKTVPMKTRLEPGRKYTYTLSVGIDDVKFLQELIEEELKK